MNQGPTLQEIEQQLTSHRSMMDLHRTAAINCEIILNQAREMEGLRKQVESSATIIGERDQQVRSLTEQVAALKLTTTDKLTTADFPVINEA